MTATVRIGDCHFAPGCGAKHIAMSMSVCLSVCPLALLEKKLWPWLSPLLAALRYVMYLRFCDYVMFLYGGLMCIHVVYSKRG